jgi:hypothetical protein
VLAFAIGVSGPATAGFQNTDNTPFNTRCSGPQGAIVVDVANSLVQTAGVGYSVHTSHNPAKLAAAAASLRRMQRYGLARPRAEVRFPRTVVHTQGSRLVLPNLMQAAQAGGGLGDPTNDLTFVFEGWSDGDRAALQSYLRAAMPKARMIYGAPAFSATVKIIQDNTIQDIQGGTYDVTTNEIRIPPLSGNFPEDTYVLLMLVLNAFHDDALLFYDSWEQGMIGAAAYVIQTQPGVSAGYDPIDPGPFYALSVYECENLPELGNSTYYPASGAANMLVWRIAMARAAWLKCWIENPQFFAQFNQLYYASFAPTLPGDIPSLKELAAQAVPTVEGQPFAEWYEHQYVLDTSVRLGPKLFTWNIPLTEAVGLIAELYETLPDGDERPFGGQARTTYWNDDLTIQLYAEEGNLIDIPPGGSTPGEGFLLPTFFNIGGPQRITVQADAAGLRRQYPFAYGVRGFNPGENNLYGAMVGANAGKVSATGGSGLTDLAVSRGVWGDRITAASLSPMQVAVTFTADSGDSVTRRYNIGWDSYCCLMPAGGQAARSHTFTYDLNGVYLMSLPLLPLNGDAAAVLGIPADQLLLAWWDPLLGGDTKYRIWPSFPFRNPGPGYWLRVPADTEVAVQGIEADVSRPYEVPLAAGWNLIGSPRLADVPLANLQVQAGDQAAVSWDDAVTGHLVQRGIFSYSQTAGYELADVVQPWRGYWARCLEPNGVQVIFPAQTAAATAAAAVRPAAAAKSDGLAWKLPLVVSAGRLRSTAAYLGAAAKAATGPDVFDLVAPPSFGDCVQARFVHADWGGGSGSYLTDVRPAGTGSQRWDMEVSCTLPGTDVTLSWPDLSGLPASVKPVLVDQLTGRRQYLRTTTAFSFRTGPQGGTRQLALETSAGAAGLMVSALSAQGAGLTATISYALSAEAAVDLRVLNMAGRPIRRVATAVQQSAGLQLMAWNARDDAGRAVPSGLYLVELVARAADGQQARALATLQVRR